jgi:hypothetical protein
METIQEIPKETRCCIVFSEGVLLKITQVFWVDEFD